MRKKIMMLACCIGLVSLSQQINVIATEEQAESESSIIEVQEMPSLVIEREGNGVSVDNQYNSILQIVVSFKDNEEKSRPIQGGSGFLIGDDETQLQYLITTKQIAVVSDELKEQLVSEYNLEKKEDIREEIQVVIDKDVTINASVVAISEEMDFAILQLSQCLHDRQALILNDKEPEEYLRQNVSALGYPTAAENGIETAYYTSSDLQKIDGFLEVETVIGGQTYLQHHIFPNYGNLGGPIVDSNDTVVALNQARNDGKNFYALQITEIMPVMDSLGIPYKTVSQVEQEEAAIAAAIVHKDELNRVIATAEQIDLSNYKKKSIEGFAECLEEVKRIQDDEEATQKEVDQAQSLIQTAVNGLVPKMPFHIVLMIAAACFVVGMIVIIIILIATKDARKARKEKKKSELTVQAPSPVFQNKQSVMETSYKDLLQAGNKQVANENIWTPQQTNEENFDQTTVLSAAMPQHTAMASKQFMATLIRGRDNENILVNKFPFVIGKEQGKTDYCVRDNSAVSRVHASIFYEENRFFIQDNHATNGTFVNKKRLPAGEKTELHNNDKIILGNEEFDFKVGLIG